MRLLHRQKDRGPRGFTLVELIGVLSIVATLGAIVVPEVLGSMSRSRVMDAVGCYNSVKAGAITYAAKHGFLGNVSGQVLDVTASPDVAAHWDREVLLKLKLIDEVFHTRVSPTVLVEVRNPTSDQPDGSNAAYNLVGTADTGNYTAGARHVLDVRLNDVLIEYARELNRYLDGTSVSLGESAEGVDLRGRVKYDFSGGASLNMGDVYLYVTHL